MKFIISIAILVLVAANAIIVAGGMYLQYSIEEILIVAGIQSAAVLALLPLLRRKQ